MAAGADGITVVDADSGATTVVLCESATVGGLRSQIASWLRRDPSLVGLCFAGTVLHNDAAPLAAFNILPGATVHATRALGGGHFYVREMSGRTTVPLTGCSGTVEELQHEMGVVLGVEPDRVALILAGTVLTESTRTLASYGVCEQCTVYAVVTFRAPPALFDGHVHPFSLNGVYIGGVAGTATREDFLVSVGLDAAFERDNESGSRVVELGAYESERSVLLPVSIAEFLTMPRISPIVQERLAFSPIVASVAEADATTGGPDIVLFAHAGVAMAAKLVLYDHQGCCYWYGVWPTAGPRSTDCEVYVLYGGQAFEAGRTAYKTADSLWKFLSAYPRN